jgi:hypothetical protein
MVYLERVGVDALHISRLAEGVAEDIRAIALYYISEIFTSPADRLIVLN